jgi:antitoxin VapB
VALAAYAKHMLKKGPNSERHVRVFRNGRNQAVRIPREFEFPAEEAIMRKQGHRLIIEPVPAKSLRVVLAGLKPLREKFPRIPDTPAEPVGL